MFVQMVYKLWNMFAISQRGDVFVGLLQSDITHTYTIYMPYTYTYRTPSHTHGIYWNDLTCCHPVILIMTFCEQKVQEFNSCSVPKVGCLSWSVFMPVKECMNVLLSRQGKQANSKSIFFYVLIQSSSKRCGPDQCPAASRSRLEVDSSTSN